MKTKLIALILASLMCLNTVALTSCLEENAPETSEPSTETTEKSEDTTTKGEETTTEEEDTTTEDDGDDTTTEDDGDDTTTEDDGDDTTTEDDGDDTTTEDDGEDTTTEPEESTTEHTHVYDKSVATSEYLKTAATCTESAVYYKSCSCGAKGTETFTSGDPIAHTFNKEIVDSTYLKTAATCTESAVYYKSCVCGAKGTETFTSGDPIAHTFDKEIVGATYLKTAATCTESAVYYKSCVCGAKGEETFVVEGLGDHRFASEWTSNETHHWHASVCGHNSVIADKAAHTYGGDYICDVCRYEVPGNLIFSTLTVEGTNVSGTVSNATQIFSFLDEVEVSGSASYVVSLDALGMQTVVTKKVALQEGDNTVYVIEVVGDDITVYTVTIRRRPMYTVSFDTKGGTAVTSQRIEEGSVASEPSTTRTGYTFAGWNHDFSDPITADKTVSARWTNNPYVVTYDVNGGTITNATTNVGFDLAYTLETPTRVGYTFAGWYNGNDAFAMSGTWTLTQNITLKAKWTANSNTAYKVEHYLEKLDGSYELRDTDHLTGTSDTQVTPSVKTYAGFTAPMTQTVTVLPDGSQVVKYYYTRNSYTISFNSNGGSSVTAKTLKYEEAYTIPAPTRVGYTFAGWYNGNDLIELTGTWTIAENTTLKAKWTANTNKAYKVEHYLEKLDGTYELRDTDNLTGTSDSEVTPDTKNYTGFTAPTAQTVTILPDGSQVVKYYYTRNSYTITFVTNGGNAIQSQRLKYEQEIQQVAIRSGFTFGGWFTDVNLSASIEKVPAQNRTLYAYWSEENKSSDFTYSGTSTITITDYKASDTTVTLPSYIGGKAVTSIGSSAFEDCSSLTIITIPNSVTSIGSYAFYYCRSLTSVTIGNSVKSIGDRAFYYCNSLTSITIPNSVTSIGYAAFYNCDSVTSITIPNSVTSIGGSAFYDCGSLTSVTIGNSVTSIGERAFYYCSSLTSIEIPNSVTSIGSDAFYHCDSLTSVTIGNSVTSIGERAFFGCSSLTSVTIGNSVTSIGSYVFEKCDSLTSIEIPNSVTSIGSSVFLSCGSLTSITVANDNDHYASIDGNLYSKDKTTLIQYAVGKKDTTFVIPNSVTSIGSDAFYHCDSLTSIAIPNSVTSIGSFAFRDCDSLTSIEIPNSVTSIGDSAFYNCDSLTSIEIPNSVTSISSLAFYNCDSLTSVTIPNRVTSIGDYAFYDCDGLMSITIPNSVTSIGYNAFYNCDSLTSVTFENKQGWKAGSTSISSSALYYPSTAATYLKERYCSYDWTRS